MKKIIVNDEVVKVRARIDMLIEEVKGVEEEIQTLQEVYEIRMRLLKEDLEKKLDSFNSIKKFKMTELEALFDLAEPKETKTQEKLSLISGDVVRKKSYLKYEPNRAELIEWAKHNDKSLIKSTIKEDLDWSTLKDRLVMQQDLEGHTVALDTATGEILQCVNIVEVKAETEVK